MKSFIDNYQIAIYCIVNLTITFVLLIILDIDYIPQWMPGLSAILLVGLLWKRKGVKVLFRKLAIRKHHIYWYLPAILIPAVSCLIVYFMMRLSLVSLLTNIPEMSFTDYLQTLKTTEVYNWKEYGLLACLILFGSIGEEIGWRGYMLPKLMQKNSFLKSNLITGFVWGLWHFMFDSGFSTFCFYLLFSIETSIIISWLCYQTNKFIVVAVLYHTTINICGFLLFEILFHQIYPQAQLLFFGYQVLLLAIPCIYIVRYKAMNKTIRNT